MEKSVKNGFVKGVVATLILCLCLVGGYWGLTRWILTSVPSANIQANVVSVTDEHVKIILEATDGKKVLTNAMVVEDSGKLYLLERGELLRHKLAMVRIGRQLILYLKYKNRRRGKHTHKRNLLRN